MFAFQITLKLGTSFRSRSQLAFARLTTSVVPHVTVFALERALECTTHIDRSPGEELGRRLIRVTLTGRTSKLVMFKAIFTVHIAGWRTGERTRLLAPHPTLTALTAGVVPHVAVLAIHITCFGCALLTLAGLAASSVENLLTLSWAVYDPASHLLRRAGAHVTSITAFLEAVFAKHGTF